MNEAPRAEWTHAGIPTSENSNIRHLMTVFVDTSGHGKTNGNLEYSSTTIRKFLFPLIIRGGPLKLMLILSNG